MRYRLFTKAKTVFDNRMNTLEKKVDRYTKQVNKVIKKTNTGVGLICDRLDEHQARLNHITSQQKLLMDSYKTLSNKMDRLQKGKEKNEQKRKKTK